MHNLICKILLSPFKQRLVQDNFIFTAGTINLNRNYSAKLNKILQNKNNIRLTKKGKQVRPIPYLNKENSIHLFEKKKFLIIISQGT